MRVGAGAALVTGLVLTLGAGCGVQSEPVAEDPVTPRAQPATPSEPGPGPGPRRRPDRDPQGPANVVLVLMDDFSMDLLQTMGQGREMVREGASYEHSYVVDSLCCVSRSSLLTGQYPHQTGVRTNTANTPNSLGPLGGWEAFSTYGNEERSVNVRLQEAGWTTGYVGKFLNQYEYAEGEDLPHVPPGWSSWQPVFGNAYDGWDFDLLDADRRRVRVEHVDAPRERASERRKDAAYAGTVIADRALDFMREHRDDEQPYFLTVAPYGVHSRVGPDPHYSEDPGFPPAFRDRPHGDRPGNCGAVACARLGVPDLPGFGDDQSDNAPRYADGSPAAQWRPEQTYVTGPWAVATIRQRAQMAQSIDRMVARIRALAGPDTYVVLTSDNGLHIGQHDLDRGKGTPFVSDVRVPLVVTGPGVEPGTRQEVVSNLDVAPTLEDLAGLRPRPFRAGTSLVPTFADPELDRRRFAFFEHTFAPSLGGDPDASYASGTMDLIPSYVAVRSRTGLLVRFDLDSSWAGVDPAWEFYDYEDVAWEKTNRYADPAHAEEVARLTRRLDRFDRCQEVTGDDAVPDRCRRLTQ